MAVMDMGTHCYVGQLPCGCGVSIARDMPQFKKETAKAVADMVKGGLNVTRLEHTAACDAFEHRCNAYPHEDWQKRFESDIAKQAARVAASGERTD